MGKFIKLDKVKLTNGLHIEFMYLFKEKMSAIDTIGNEELENYFSSFNEAYNEENRCYKLSKGSDLTQIINQTDNERDMIYSCIRNIINAWSNNGVYSSEQSSAKKLKSVLNNYKIDNQQQKDEQTSRIRNLIEDLQSPTMQTHLTKLNITALVQTLKEKNMYFAVLIDQRNTEKGLKQKGALRNARLVIDNIYDEILSYIEAAERFTHAESYTNFINNWNNTINYYVNIFERKSYNYSNNNDDQQEEDDNSGNEVEN